MTHRDTSLFASEELYRDRIVELCSETECIQQAQPSTVLPMHYHPENLVLEVRSGLATIVMDDKTMHLRPGQQVAIPAGRFHSTYFGGHGCTYKLSYPDRAASVRKGGEHHATFA